jgi:hypothetical protein
VALLSDIIDVEPTSYQEVVEKKGWKDAMIEEYQSIVKNDVWDVVLRPKEKKVVRSKWIYSMKYSVDASVEKYREGSWRVVSPRKKESIMRRHLLM